MTTDAGHPDNTRRHRALADPRRAQIVRELERRQAGVDVESLARALALHPNTVRWHLGVLADAGIAESHTVARRTPGRPRVAWRISPRDAGPRDNHRLLATILTGAVADSVDGVERAVAAGRAWGRYLVERPPPHVRPAETDAVAAVVALLDHEGFEPEQAEDEIRMRRCPFRDLAETHGRVVCPVHGGLIAGALEELGSSQRLTSLDPFVEPDLCVARLGRRD